MDTELPQVFESTELSIASSVIPYPRDDHRAQFLGYRCSGMSVREALYLTGVTASAVSHWREDPAFADLERRIPEFRQTLAKEYAELEFFRNFRLVMEKDRRVLNNSLVPLRDGEGVELPMSKQDHDYLLKLRAQYTPQQLQLLQAVLNANEGEGFNWTKLLQNNPDLVRMSRTDTVTFTKGKDNGE